MTASQKENVFKPMLAKDGGIAPEKYPVALEPKYDGIRALAAVRGIAGKEYTVSFQSRSGKPFPSRLAKLAEHIAESVNQRFAGGRGMSLPRHGFVLDGELVARDGTFGDTQSLVMAKHGGDPSDDLRFMVFDMIPLGMDGSPCPIGSMEPYALRRREALERIVPTLCGMKLAPMVIAYNERMFQDFRTKCRAFGFEGVMSKDLDATYKPGRSGAWRKHKDILTLDARVVSFEEGVGKFAGMLGAVMVEGEYEGRTVRCRVGTGFTDEQRHAFWESRDAMRGQMVEVECQEITVDGSARFPVFLRTRECIGAEKA